VREVIRAQETLDGEIIVDSFAGGGGASTGIELALGRIVNIAINHDPAAILMHQTNHPYTEHFQASVWDVDPEEVCRGRPVGLAWFSPDCKHFSKAKGSALVDRNIRGLAWIVLRWAGTVRPRVIILENVEEFQTWGPVRKGKPVKSKSGQTFHKWLAQLEDLGYTVEHRELVAADYGAPTTRRRFVLIARCDGRPIVWPERTHAPADHPDTIAGKFKPWRSAAEIIDWTQPMYSIFATKQEIKERYGVNAVRPLADNTLRRIIRGVDKFTIRSGKPFLVPTGYGERKGQAPRVHDIDAPLPTVVSTGKHNVCSAVVSPITFSNTCNSVGNPANQPVSTIRTGGGGGLLMSAANLIQYHTEQTEAARVNGLTEPMPTVDASNRYGLAAANLVEYFSTGRPLSVEEPLHTVTSHDREALTACHVVEFKGQDKGQSAADPLRTITTSAGEFGVASVRIERYAPGADLGYWPEIRTLLNRFCGYTLKDDEVLLLMLGGTAYYLSDILLRMLIPRELYNAMGFPPDYIIDRDYTGKPYPKSAQVARCGNSVPPPMARAVVAANLPEYQIIGITTMHQLMEVVAV
jgi:DNA (cytosine-5)-methyltransferase 1